MGYIQPPPLESFRNIPSSQMFISSFQLQVVPASGHFDVAEFFELVGTHRQVSCFLAPTMVKRLVDHLHRTGYAFLKLYLVGDDCNGWLL